MPIPQSGPRGPPVVEGHLEDGHLSSSQRPEGAPEHPCCPEFGVTVLPETMAHPAGPTACPRVGHTSPQPVKCGEHLPRSTEEPCVEASRGRSQQASTEDHSWGNKLPHKATVAAGDPGSRARQTWICRPPLPLPLPSLATPHDLLFFSELRAFSSAKRDGNAR